MRKKRIGQDIQKTIEIVRSHKLDIDAKVTVRYLSSGEKKVKNTLDFRFIAVYNERTDEYHTHFTNIPEEELDGRDVASCMRQGGISKIFFGKQRARIYWPTEI